MALSRTFPPEVLAIVTDFTCGIGVTRLWLCGDLLLQKKLQLAVTRFKVVWNGLRPLEWPVSVKYFPKLARLELSNHEDVQKWHCVGFEASLFPKSLTALVLAFPNADWSFEKPKITDGAELTMEFVPIGELLPNLKELSLLNLARTRGVILKALPTHLEKLVIVAEGSSMPNEWVSQLPAGLKHIEGICSTPLVEESLTTPICPQLEHWRVSASFEATLVRRFPAGLKSIVVNPPMASMLPIINASVRRLPRSLTELELWTHCVSRRWLNLLPKSLTYLYLCVNYHTGTIDFTSALPNLRRLRLVSPTVTQPPQDNAMSLFKLPEIPPQIEHLEIDAPVEWQSLPAASKLNHLHVKHNVTAFPGTLELPPSLKTLRLESRNHLHITLTRLFTPHLTALYAPWEFAIGHAAILPRTLQILHVHGWTCLEEAAELPPKLQELVASNEYERGRRVSYHTLPSSHPRNSKHKEPIPWPKTLQRLELQTLSNFPDSCFASLADLTELHTLYLGSTQDMCSLDIMNFIPPSLKSITMKSRDALTAEHLKHCPPRMRFIDIQSTEDTRLTDTDLLLLPRGLAKLHLPISPSLTDDFAEFLPPYLPKLGTVINRSKLVLRAKES